MDDKSPNTPQPQSQEPTNPAVSNELSPNSVQSAVGNSTAATLAPAEETQPKKQNHRIRLSIIGIVSILIIGFGVAAAVNQNFRANIFMLKLETYTFTNEQGNKYRLLFYRNSVTGRDTYSSGDNTPYDYLIAPNQDNNNDPIEVSMGEHAIPATPNQTLTQYINELSDCTIGGNIYKVAFSTYITSVSATVKVCAVYASPNKQNPKFYVTAFKNSSGDKFYVVEIEQELNDGSAKTASQSAEGLNGNLNIAVYQNDIKKIISSFQPLSP